jgi:uncharacterized protein (TIGR01777 family)
LFTTAFQFQCVARFQLQLLSQGLGDNDSARFVHDETRVHFGMIIWVDPQINAIYLAEKWQLSPLGTKFKEVTPVNRILASGVSGPIGAALLASFEPQSTQIVRLVRGRAQSAAQVSWDPLAPVSPAAVSGFDAVVHLAGETVVGRWTEEKKRAIRESRVQGTRNLAAALAQSEAKPRVLVCASAVGFYGNRGEELLREESPAGQGFLSEVCREWEDASRIAAEAGIRTVNIRIGLVLSAKGGALANMLKPFKLGLGGRIGSGQQWWSWIHVDDIVGGIHHAIGAESLSGPVNLVAPNPVRNAEFTKVLASVLGRPAFFPVPEFALRLAFGKMAAEELLLASQRVEPGKLGASGYAFRFRELRPALENLV